MNQVGLLVIPLFGWRAMFVIGGLGALGVWWLRKRLPESPRWLESRGRASEAERVLEAIETEAAAEGALPPVLTLQPQDGRPVGIGVLFTRPVIRRTLLAIGINVVVLVCSYSFTSWIPTFFIKQGFTVTRSLAFNAAMSCGAVAGPLLGFLACRSDRTAQRPRVCRRRRRGHRRHLSISRQCACNRPVRLSAGSRHEPRDHLRSRLLYA